MSELQGAVAVAQLEQARAVRAPARGHGRAAHGAPAGPRGHRDALGSPPATSTCTGGTACGWTAGRSREAPRSSAVGCASGASPRRRATSRSRPSSARYSASSAPSAAAAGRSVWRDPRPSTIRRSASRGPSRRSKGVLVLPWNERYTEEHVDYAGGLAPKRPSPKEAASPWPTENESSDWWAPERIAQSYVQALRDSSRWRESRRVADVRLRRCARALRRGCWLFKAFPSHKELADRRRLRGGHRLHAPERRTPNSACDSPRSQDLPVLCEKPLSGRF